MSSNGRLFLSCRCLGPILLAALSLAAGTSLAGCKRQPPTPGAPAAGAEEIPLSVRIFFRPLPPRMPGGDEDTPERITLGRQLFFERGLSRNKSQSCNDCHRLDGGRPGADPRQTSRGALGLSGRRNSPTVLNAGFQIAQFWDGRASELAEQAKGPLLDPMEMALRSEQDVVDCLQGEPQYRRAFEHAFPNQAEPITLDNVARALAAFERTLLTPARFDRYLRGETDALTLKEKSGLHVFEDTGCVECHAGIPVGGRYLKKLGIYHPYANQSDLGRFEVTHQEQDKLVFKVAMLRNVTRTAPYFHDGGIATLPEAVQLMAWMQLDVRLDYLEIDEIVCFLRSLEAESFQSR